MNRLSYMIKAIMLAWMASPPAWAAGGYLFESTGSVSITADQKFAPRLAVKGDKVASGTVIKTGDGSYAVLKFEDGQLVSLQANTTFQVREYRYEPRQIEQSRMVFSLFKGGMRFISGQIGLRNKQAFRLATPKATISTRGTEFMTVITKNATYSKAQSGTTSMTNAAGLTELTTGQIVLTTSATELTTSIPAASASDDIFSQITAIPVPVAAAAPVPLPAKPL